ncbi:hypothetical protein P5673_017114 [Acropora cervicornis]|uniref:Uncharacterized protein n=1 Tax=Acropora cervicornis TaxID=6130 RepID=A0AAD9QF15_ACRCE|nr:hypothetical protein P5673_017114 [Acropora cervicornis]
MEPSFLIIFYQRFCLRVVCTQTLLKSHLVVIRPTDKGFPCNLWNAEREFSCRRPNSFGEPIVCKNWISEQCKRKTSAG